LRNGGGEGGGEEGGEGKGGEGVGSGREREDKRREEGKSEEGGGGEEKEREAEIKVGRAEGEWVGGWKASKGECGRRGGRK